MPFLNRILPPQSVSAGLATLSVVVVLGLALGAVRVRGIRLGIPGVLFSGLLFGQLGLTVDSHVLSFLSDFSLIIFIYAIGLQVGPSFVDSLKAEGLRLNLLSIALLAVGAVMTALVVLLIKLPPASASGLYSGAFTTTPGLAAGQEVLSHAIPSPSDATVAVQAAGLAYAVTYPFGMIGPALMIALFKKIFKIDMQHERDAHAAALQGRRPPNIYLDIEVTNTAVDGVAVKELSFVRQHGILFSRLLRDKKMFVPTGETRICIGDKLRALGPKSTLDKLLAEFGQLCTLDLAAIPGELSRSTMLVTRTAILGKPLHQLDFINRYGVTLATLTRAGVDVLPTASLTLHFGDSVLAVGPADGLASVEKELGNSPDELNRPKLLPIFLGMVLGIIVGSIPIGGFKLGLAAGPLLVAILLSRLGNIGSVIWYMPAAANQLLRDFGLALFLACVGMQQGDSFLSKLFGADGIKLVFWGAFLTVVPLLLVSFIARRFFKMNFLTLSGWAAGAMTSSPALIYAGEITQSDAPALAYAAVAPLAMIVPIICCQLLAELK
jgi:putative transport protein